ncbi:hypothetical protein WJX84_009434 [Apatococcus fuscideae]|uniref:Uncharacterized protein n=1 Tax=Apatococcus fuscideae TaxID=2026836 RepID=A0AAW1T307_9CHLO
MLEDADFQRICTERLQLQPEARDLATALYEECQSVLGGVHLSDFPTNNTATPLPSTPGQSKQDTGACRVATLLYLTRTILQTRPPTSSSRTIHEAGHHPQLALANILLSCNLSLASFMRELPSVLRAVGPAVEPWLLARLPSAGSESDLERLLQVRELQASYVYATVLAKKFKDIFTSCFEPHLQNLGEDGCSVYNTAWLLFLYAKARLLPPFPDLVSSFNLLLCTINFLLAHVPLQHQCFLPSDAQRYPVRTGEGAADTLQSLVAHYRASLVDALPLASALNALLQSDLASLQGQARLEHPQPVDLHTSCLRIPRLFSDESGSAALLQKLEQELQEKLDMVLQEPRCLDFDERPFLLLGSDRKVASHILQSPGPISSLSSPRSPLKSRTLLSPLRPELQAILASPSPMSRLPAGMCPPTPITSALGASSWLRNMAANTAAQPSLDLHRFLKACQPDLASSIPEQADRLADAAFPASTSSQSLTFLQTTICFERRQEGLKLYFRVLEAMVRSESGRKGRLSLTDLLTSRSFHTCLLACSFEIISAAYHMANLQFPAVLERLSLHAFDFRKIIQPFMRHEPNMPRELKRHLLALDEKILEAVAWTRNSSLYTCLALACGPLMSQSLHDGHAPASGAAGLTARSSGGEECLDGSEAGPKSSPATPVKRKSSGGSMPWGSGTPKARRGDVGLTPSSSLPSQDDDHTETPLSPRHSSGTSPLASLLTPIRPAAQLELPTQDSLPLAFCQPGEEPAAADDHRPCRTAVADFLLYVLRLAARRLSDLCQRMSFEPLSASSVLEQAYTVMHHVVYQQTHLLYNRHLDQILLSALYGVCKVNQLRMVSFKEIIAHYKRQPQSKSDIFRNVSISQARGPAFQVERSGDVIEFYNIVFIPSVKAFLLHLSQRSIPILRPPKMPQPGIGMVVSPTASLSGTGSKTYQTPPAVDRTLKLLAEMQYPPNPVQSPGRVIVSPMQKTPDQVASPIPKARMLTASIGGHMQNYRSPSRSLSYINGCINAPAQARQGGGIVAFPSLGSRGSASSERSVGRSESSGDGDEAVEAGRGSSSGGATHSSGGGPDPDASAAAAAAASLHQRSPRKRHAAGKQGGLARRGSADQSSSGGMRQSSSGTQPNWNEGVDEADLEGAQLLAGMQSQAC